MSTNTAANAPPRAEEGEKSYFSSIVRSIGIFVLMQVVMQYVIPSFTKSATSNSTQGAGTAAVAPSAIGNFADRPSIETVANYSAIPQMLAPIWADDSVLDIRVHVSPKLQLPPLASLPAESLVISEDNFKIGDWKYNKEIQTTITLPSEAQHNGSLFAHIFAGLHGYELDPSSSSYDPAKAAHYVKQLNHYIPKKKARKQRNLLEKTEEVELEPEEPTGPQISSYWHPNFTLAVIPQTGVQNWQTLHPGLRRDILMEPTGARDASGQNGWYYPVFFLNTFWQLKSHMTELNETVKS